MIEIVDSLGDWRWRLTNLYWIVDEYGKKVKFQPNAEQLDLLQNLHAWNLVLKARQLGFTTLIDILGLDQTIFTPNYSAAIIAHGLREARSVGRLFDSFPPSQRIKDLPSHFLRCAWVCVSFAGP